jgi:uracil DNA glycosylase
VVILGQDPYINLGEAMGLSFSVPPGVCACVRACVRACV